MISIRNYFFLLIIVTAWFSCAKQSSPMGGPKDEDPPILIETSPKDQATNVQPKEINLTFNEYVQLDNPTKLIIITPRIKVDEVEFLAIKNRVNIKLNQTLEKETTYVFNFQKSVQDITEKTPAENLKLVFSTGATIDSLTLSGTVDYIFPPKDNEFKDVLVGLYAEEDTTDLFTSPPYYIAQVDTVGRFAITNIKAGRFRLYTWHDDNNSLKAEFRNESYGFYPEPLEITENMTGLHLNLFKGDLSELKINRSGTSGTNYDIILSKPPISYTIEHEEVGKTIFHRLNDKTIRIYSTELLNDSTQIQLNIQDSVGFKIDTALYAKFEESDRKPEQLEITVNSGLSFLNTIESQWNFNKPIKTINFDSLYVTYDTAGRIPIAPKDVHFTDSTKFTQLNIKVQIPDSLNIETYTVYVGDSTIRDIEGIYNKEPIKASYKKLKQDRLSDGISGKILTEERPIIVQLINKQNTVVQELYLTETNEYEFTKIEAGDYKLRAIVDRNSNKRWDPGNYRENQQPEPVYFYYDNEKKTQEFMLKGGWLLNEININTRPDTGNSPQKD